MRGRTKERTLTVNTVKTFAQTLRMMALSKELIETDDIATKREAYYVSKNWDEARFNEQPESDTVMDDVEALFGVNREQLGFIPEEKGGEVAGELVVIDRTARPARSSGSTAPSSAPAPTRSRSRSSTSSSRRRPKFILVDRDRRHVPAARQAQATGRQANCILVSMGGVPTRACRRFIRRLADDKKIPVYVFVDGDPYGISNIYRTLKVGSGNAAHINEFFCVPQARFLGRHAAGHHRLQAADPPAEGRRHQAGQGRAQERPVLPAPQALAERAIEQLLKMGVRAEQQALAKHGLNYVIDDYLPEKLKSPERFLP